MKFTRISLLAYLNTADIKAKPVTNEQNQNVKKIKKSKPNKESHSTRELLLLKAYNLPKDVLKNKQKPKEELIKRKPNELKKIKQTLNHEFNDSIHVDNKSQSSLHALMSKSNHDQENIKTSNLNVKSVSTNTSMASIVLMKLDMQFNISPVI